MDEFVKKIATNKYLTVIVLFKELFNIAVSIVQFSKTHDMNAFANFDYFNFVSHLILFAWLFYTVGLYQKNNLIIKYFVVKDRIQYDFISISGVNLGDDVLKETINKVFTKKELSELIAMHVISPDSIQRNEKDDLDYSEIP